MNALSARSRFYSRYLGVPLLLALITFLAFDLTDLDRLFSNLFMTLPLAFSPLVKVVFLNR